MPAKDIYHDVVKNALIKDGWTITHDPLRLSVGNKDMYIDFGVERVLAAEKADQKIAIEAKSFVGNSEIDDLEKAIGQMDTLENYRQIIETTLDEYTRIPYAHGDFHTEAAFDRAKDRYLLVNVGWDNGRRVHGSLVHIDIINGKIWIQRDGTEEGVAKELVKAGIPKDRIVLAFHPPEIRPHTEYAVA